MKRYHLIVISILIIYMFIISGCINNEKKNEIEKITVYFNEELNSSSTHSNYTNEGQSTIIKELIEIKNLTRIEFNLSWIDDRPGWRGDEFQLYIEAPNGAIVNFTPMQSVQLEDFEGEIKIIAIINAIPINTTINENKLETVLEDAKTENGYGEWKIKITCINAYYAGDVGHNKDYGNDWDLTINIYYYKGCIEK